MNVKRFLIFLSIAVFLTISLTLFSGSTKATKVKPIIQPDRLANLEHLASIGKIPPIRKQFKEMAAKAPAQNFGLIPQLHEDPVTQPIVESSIANVLPRRWDWREHNGVSPVGQQGYTGSCWVWGSLKGFEANVLVDTGNYYDLAERTIFNCSPWNNDDPPGSRGGLAIMVANWLSTKGAVPEECDPWQWANWYECLYDQCTPLLASFGWTRIPYDVNTIKKYLYEYGPIHTSMFAGFPDFNDYDGTYCMYWTGADDSNHCVQIVGWDDTMPYGDEPPYRYGAWICQNSWGTGWGQLGYFYIAYDPGYNANCGEHPAFYASHQFWPIPYMLGKLYFYDETGPSTWAGSGVPGNTLYYGAVIFEATTLGTIRYLETWIPDGNTIVESWIYRSFNTGSPNGPVELLRHQPSITFATGGFKRLRLSRNLLVRPGDSFVVVLKVDTDTYDYPLAVEHCYDGTDCIYETAKCWESEDASPGSWYDSGQWDYDLAIRARAFRLTPIAVELKPYEGIVKIGEKYEISWSPSQHTEVTEKYLTIDVVEYNNTENSIYVIGKEVPMSKGVFVWEVKDDFEFSPETEYCIRIIGDDALGTGKPFKIVKP